MTMRKTKIICTLGPSTDKEGVLESLMKAGMNVARCNFSHGSHEEHRERFELVKRLRKKLGLYIPILLDTKGPEIRLGVFEDGMIELKEGQEFTLVCGRDFEGTSQMVGITYANLYKDVKVGTTILIDDGLVEMTVKEIDGSDIICTVINPGRISDRKGVNVPDVHINMEYLSKQDESDILFGIENDVDYIAASFVRNKEDVRMIRRILNENGGEDIGIIAKIENSEGIANIDEIIEAADAIMIARGDMGVELPEEEVPVIQKMIIKKVYEAGKRVITATQMLESMINNPRPTRAETADIANAVYDGTSGIMLSGETAAGKYPIEALKTMVRIAERTEHDINYKQRFFDTKKNESIDITEAVCHATCTTAYDLNAKAILTVTKSGRSARMISRHRPECMVIAGATSEKVCRQLNLSWGVVPVLINEKKDLMDLIDYSVKVAKSEGLINIGDIVVVTAGMPLGVSGNTNVMKVHTVC